MNSLKCWNLLPTHPPDGETGQTRRRSRKGFHWKVSFTICALRELQVESLRTELHTFPLADIPRLASKRTAAEWSLQESGPRVQALPGGLVQHHSGMPPSDLRPPTNSEFAHHNISLDHAAQCRACWADSEPWLVGLCFGMWLFCVILRVACKPRQSWHSQPKDHPPPHPALATRPPHISTRSTPRGAR